MDLKLLWREEFQCLYVQNKHYTVKFQNIGKNGAEL